MAGMCLAIVFHAWWLLAPGPHFQVVSRLATASVPLLAAGCGLWRAGLVGRRERFPWIALSVCLVLWATGQIVEAFVGQSALAANLNVDASDFFYLNAGFPLVIALSSTRRTASVRAVMVVDSAQLLLAGVLSFVLLYKTHFAPGMQSVVLARVYESEAGLQAFIAVFRLIAGSSR